MAQSAQDLQKAAASALLDMASSTSPSFLRGTSAAATESLCEADPASRTPQLSFSQIVHMSQFTCDPSLRAPDIDASIPRTPAQKSEIRRQEREKVDLEIRLAQRGLSPSSMLSSDDESDSPPSAPVSRRPRLTPAQREARLNGQASFNRMMALPRSSGERPYSEQDYESAERESLKRRLVRDRGFGDGGRALGPKGLDLSAHPSATAGL